MPDKEQDVAVELQIIDGDNNEPLNQDDVDADANIEKVDPEDPKKKEDVVKDIVPNVVTKFDAFYIETKLYEFDKSLGGNIEENEKLVKKFDKFYLKSDDLKNLASRIKKNQEERTKVKSNPEKVPELTQTIKSDMESFKVYKEELGQILREQFTSADRDESTEEFDSKEKMFQNWMDIYDNFDNIEEKV